MPRSIGFVVTAAVFIIGSVGSIAATLGDWRLFNAETGEQIIDEARSLSWVDDFDSLSERTESIVQIRDVGGTVLHQEGTVPPATLSKIGAMMAEVAEDRPEAISSEVKVDGVRWRIAAAPCRDQETCAAIAVLDPEPTWWSFVAERWARTLVWPLVAGLGAGLAIALWVRRSLAPLVDLAEALDAVATGDLEHEMPAPGRLPLVRRLRDSLDGALGTLREQIESSERLVADAAHELRSPLTAVRGSLELNAAQGEQSDVDLLTPEIDRANQLLDDLLLMAKTPSMWSRLEVVDVDDTVNYEVGRIRRSDTSVEIETEVLPVQARVIGESLSRIVRNLLDNAVKYGDGKVRVSLSSTSDELTLRVDDNGTGIPIEERDRIVRRFERADESGAEGSGIGMAIITDLVEAHLGTLSLTSSPMGGCQAKVTLPTRLTEDRLSAGTQPPRSTSGRRRFLIASMMLVGVFVLAATYGLVGGLGHGLVPGIASPSGSDPVLVMEADGGETGAPDSAEAPVRLNQQDDLDEVLTVTSVADAGPGSLREVVGRIAEGGTIDVDPSLAGATITLTSGQLLVPRSVTIDGSAAPGLAVSGGGTSRVFEIDGDVTVTITDLTLRDGAAPQTGGGVLNNGTLTLERVIVTDNVENSPAPPNFEFGGGGIYTSAGTTLNLIDSVVADNTATNQPGGGVYGFLASTINVRGSTISGNESGDAAGGFRTLGDIDVVNSTISGNTSTVWHGGGIFHTDGTLTVTNATVTGNTAPAGNASGIVVATFGAPASMTLTNSIIEGDDGTFACAIEGGPAAVITSAGGNIDNDGSCQLDPTGDQPGTDALLGPLADNDGPTSTHAPSADSPAVDAAVGGACPSIDQRGESRPRGEGCDVGSVEIS